MQFGKHAPLSQCCPAMQDESAVHPVMTGSASGVLLLHAMGASAAARTRQTDVKAARRIGKLMVHLEKTDFSWTAVANL